MREDKSSSEGKNLGSRGKRRQGILASVWKGLSGLVEAASIFLLAYIVFAVAALVSMIFFQDPPAVILSIVGISSFWAYADARNINLSDYQVGGPGSPGGTLIGSLLFWPIVFPWYMLNRWKILRGEVDLGEPEESQSREAISKSHPAAAKNVAHQGETHRVTETSSQETGGTSFLKIVGAVLVSIIILICVAAVLLAGVIIAFSSDSERLQRTADRTQTHGRTSNNSSSSSVASSSPAPRNHTDERRLSLPDRQRRGRVREIKRFAFQMMARDLGLGYAERKGDYIQAAGLNTRGETGCVLFVPMPHMQEDFAMLGLYWNNAEAKIRLANFLSNAFPGKGNSLATKILNAPGAEISRKLNGCVIRSGNFTKVGSSFGMSAREIRRMGYEANRYLWVVVARNASGGQ